jgi:hypothetical protein
MNGFLYHIFPDDGSQLSLRLRHLCFLRLRQYKMWSNVLIMKQSLSKIFGVSCDRHCREFLVENSMILITDNLTTTQDKNWMDGGDCYIPSTGKRHEQNNSYQLHNTVSTALLLSCPTWICIIRLIITYCIFIRRAFRTHWSAVILRNWVAIGT